ncbi:MAG: Calx-beta domain-containing protein, partial [Chloroflexota bacterium]
DSLTIVAPPVFKAELLNNPNLPGGTVEIVYTLDHSGGEDSDPAAAATNLSFTLDLDGALSGLAAIGSPQSDGCGAGSTLTGTSSLTFSGGSLQPGEICTMTTTVQIPAGVAMGDYPLNTSTLAADVGGVSLTAPASSPVLDIDLISLSAQFVPTTTLPSETVEIEFKITNYSSSHAASSLALNQDLSDIFSGLTTSAVPTFDVCGGGSSLLVLSSTIVYLNAGSVASNSSCTFRLSVNMPAGAADGIYTGQTASLSGTIDGTGFTMAGVPTTFVVDATRLAFEKAFIADPSNLPGVAQSLVYTITNTDSANTIDTITFTDDLDGVLTGLTATGLPLSDICGSGSSISGTSSLTFSGGALAPGESCSFTVPVAVPGTAEAANYPSTSSEITGDLGGLAVKGNPASDTLKVAQLGIAHSFATAGAPNTTVSVTVSISNTGLIDTLDGLSFIDTLDFTLPGLTAINLPISDVCGPGSVLSGGSTLTLSNASLREFENCTFELELLLPRNVPLNSYDHTINALQQEGVDVSLPSTATLTIVRPEVSVTNTITPTDLMPGQPITATVTYTNSGIGSATEIYISNPLPPEVDVTGVITNGAILTQTTVNGISIVEQDFMASGNSQTVEVVGVVNPLLNSDGLISAVTSITATADVSTTNNTQPISFNLTMPTASIGTDSVAVSVAEEAGSVPIIVTLDSINPYAPVILTYQTTDGTATSGSDFTGTAASTLTIPAGSDSGSFTIPILDDSAVEADETFTIILTASQGGKIASTNTAVVTILNTDVLPAVPTPTPTATPTPAPISDPPQQEIYLPGILHSTVQAPDLIVQSTTLGSDGVTIVVQNVGSRPVTDGFWVDLIIDPSTPPTQANDTVGALGARGLVWGVDGSDIPLQSGDTLTLTLNDKYFRPGLATASSIPADVPVYVHVDSANELTTYGAVEELHEITQESYNNILMVVPTEETIVIISGRTTVPSGTSAPLPIRPSEAE